MSVETKMGVTENWVLDTCCMMEETCAALYRYFAELYTDNSEVSSLWAKTAQEEDSHAEQFRLAYRLHGSGIAALKIDIARAKDLLTRMESVYRQVQESPPRLKDAFRFAIKLEHSLAEYHMDSIAIFTDNSLEKLFISMRKADIEHIERLEQACDALSD
jgi:rubrerythrin